MSMTEAPYSITFKTPRGNLFTVRGNTARELGDNLNAAPEEGVLALISQIEATLAGQPARAATAQERAHAASAAAAAKPAETPATPASQGDQELPAGMGEPACETCGGPTRFDKEGLSQKSGKSYRRYLCTANNLHRATFV
jgi:hypothetical protein